MRSALFDVRSAELTLLFCLASALVTACGVPAPRSHRVDALVQLYAPLVTLGENAAIVSTRLPSLGSHSRSFTSPVIASIDGYGLADAHFSRNPLRTLAGLFSHSPKGSVVERVILTSTDRTSPNRAIARINAVFDTRPQEGCDIGFGTSETRVLVWRAGDRGTAAITIPVAIDGQEQWFSELVFASGALDVQELAPGFKQQLCEATWRQGDIARTPRPAR